MENEGRVFQMRDFFKQKMERSWDGTLEGDNGDAQRDLTGS